MKIKNLKNKLLMGTLLGTAVGYYNNRCKNELTEFSVDVIDNFDIISKNERIFKILTNVEQQKFYDEEYYKQMMHKWSRVGDIKIRKCIDFKVFYSKDVKNSVWYKEAKRIYNDGYLILPLSRPIIPSIRRLDDVYNTRYLANRIVYFPTKDYIKCIQKENECKEETLSKFWGTAASVILTTGAIFAGKDLIRCGARFTSYSVGVAKESLKRAFRIFRFDRDISEAVGRGIQIVYETVEMMNTTEEDLNDDYLYESTSTALDNEFEREELDSNCAELSKYSDITIANDIELQEEYVSVFSDLENEIIALPPRNVRGNHVINSPQRNARGNQAINLSQRNVRENAVINSSQRNARENIVDRGL